MNKKKEKEIRSDFLDTSTNYKKIQQLTGLIAAGGIAFIAIDIFFIDFDYTKKLIMFLTLGFLFIFTLAYYLIPSIYMKKSLSFLPDLFYNAGFFIVMINYGARGERVIILILLFLTISIFTKPTWLFILSVFEALTSITLFYIIASEITQAASIVSIFFYIMGIISLIIVLKSFARETVFLRNNQERLAKLANDFEIQKNEILNLIDNIPNGLISVDKNQKISIVNKTAALFFGESEESDHLIGKELNEVMPVVSNEAQILLVDEVLKTGKQSSYSDLKLVTTKGMYRISASATPVFDKTNRQLGAIITFKDITAEKSLDEQRAEFNSIASHELRTPLAVIEGFTFNLLMNKKLKYDETTKGYIVQIDSAVKSLIRLTNDILTVTKADNNQIKVAFEKTDLEKIIKEVSQDFSAKAKAKNLKLHTEIKERLPEALTDQGKFREIMTNLTENAIKFTEKGSITITAAESQKGIITIKVVDTGEGISEADQKRIFNRFYRVNDFRTQKAGGTGLGLYISRTLVTALGGKIGVESKKGEGSTFWFTIPVTIQKKVKRKESEKQLDSFIENL